MISAKRKGRDGVAKLDTMKIEMQSEFCLELMERLNAEISESVDEHAWYGMWNHTQKQADIVRLRRELNKLHKMLNPWGNGYE